MERFLNEKTSYILKGALNDMNNPCKDNNEKYFNFINFKFYKGMDSPLTSAHTIQKEKNSQI